MCLAVPGQIVDITGEDPLTRTGRVQFGGITKDINLAYTPGASEGDYVLVHVGFALTVIDESEAKEVLDYLDQIDELNEIEEAEAIAKAEESPSPS